jgi:hypothetical protein
MFTLMTLTSIISKLFSNASPEVFICQLIELHKFILRKKTCRRPAHPDLQQKHFQTLGTLYMLRRVSIVAVCHALKA